VRLDLVGRLLILFLIHSIYFTFLCSENYLSLPENQLKVYLKLLMSNYGGVPPPPPHAHTHTRSLRPCMGGIFVFIACTEAKI
jgi:hypothetical protein